MKDLAGIIPIAWVAILFAGTIGWVLNIVKLISVDTIGTLEAARFAGVLLAPLGAVLGYL